MRFPVRLGAIRIWVLVLILLAWIAYLGIWADWKAFLGSLFAVMVSVLVIFVFERVTRPEIFFEIAPRPAFNNRRKFLQMRVYNRPSIIPGLADRRPALLTSAWITFLSDKGEPLWPDRRMRGRWSSSPDPIRSVRIEGEIHWVFGDPRDTADIGVDSPEALDVVMRPQDSESCFGWHNQYIGSGEDSFEMSRGNYLAQIVVKTGGREFRETVRIVNDGSLDDFRLEPLGEDLEGLRLE